MREIKPELRLLENIEKVQKFDFVAKGLCLIESENEITVFSDVFRSKPLYIYAEDKIIYLFSSFKLFDASITYSNEIDEIAFHETLLYGTPLWDRTIFKKIKQLPAASKLTINKITGSFTIQRYWNFNIRRDNSIKTIEDAADQLDFLLKRIFNNFNKHTNYVMGLSGGLDSRLSAAYLSSRIDKDKIKLFTFGFDKRILEYKYAQKISSILGFSHVDFHELHADHYKTSLEYLPSESCGHISINHCHINSYLLSHTDEKRTNISNYYSDAIFGYATNLTKTQYEKNKDRYSQKLLQCALISDTMKHEILKDINSLLAGYCEQDNYSSPEEYIYLTERNPKFHFNLAYTQSLLFECMTPFADLELLKFMFSIPIEFRHKKRIVDYLLRHRFKDLNSVEYVSSVYKYLNKNEFLMFRILNASNSFLRVLSGGNFELFNKFQTEEQDKLLRKHFHKHLIEATKYFVSKGIMTDEQKLFFDVIPIRSEGIGERFTLISLSSLFYNK